MIGSTYKSNHKIGTQGITSLWMCICVKQYILFFDVTTFQSGIGIKTDKYLLSGARYPRRIEDFPKTHFGQKKKSYAKSKVASL